MPPKSKAATAAAAEPVALEDLFSALHRHIEAGEYPQAVKVADQVLAAAPGDEDAVRCKVVAHIKSDATDKALAAIRAAERLPIDLSYYKEMTKKCYVVYIGRVPGVYEEWKDCQKQVNNFSGNNYQGYESREVAEEKWRRHGRKKWRNFLVITTLLLFMVGYVFYFI